jgi:hypothetical protein
MVLPGALLPHAWIAYNKGFPAYLAEVNKTSLLFYLVYGFWTAVPYLAIATVQYGLRGPEGIVVLLLVSVGMAVLHWFIYTDLSRVGGIFSAIIPILSLALVGLGFLVALWVQKVAGVSGRGDR